MADDLNRVKREEKLILSADAASLSPEQLKELQEKFGLSVRVRSSVESVDKLINKIADASSYDRTYPGYDRSYDKTALTGREINPIEGL
jgi:hypothetical protein